MHANEKLKKFKSKFENILFNTFNLVGVGSYCKKDKFVFSSPEEEEMTLGLGSIEVAPEICANYPCSESCEKGCELCAQCLSEDQKTVMKLAYLEHMNLGEFKRIFPPSNVSLVTICTLLRFFSRLREFHRDSSQSFFSFS
jgi:hypothetical protein